MPLLAKRAALYVSLTVIVALWIWQIATRDSASVVPEHFSELVLRIVRNKVIVFAALFLLLRLEGEGLKDLGLHGERWPRQVLIGLGLGVLMFIALNVALTALLQSLIPPAVPAGQSVMRFFREPANLLAWLPIGIFGGGVVEELQRIFVITRFEKWLGRPGLVLGVIASSVMFGVGHLYQGLGAAISTAISGLIFALVYLRRRSALEPIVAHASSDVFAMLGATFLAR